MDDWFSWETIQRIGPQSFSEPKFNSKPSLHPWMGRRAEAKQPPHCEVCGTELPNDDGPSYCTYCLLNRE